MKQCSHLLWVIMLSALSHLCFSQDQKGTQEGYENDKVDTSKMLSPELRQDLQEIITDSPGNGEVDLEIDGLIMDETLTRSGRNFYELFYGAWSPPAGAKNFTITIKETPGRGIGIGTRVAVLINSEEVLTLPVQPRYEVIEQMAQYAVSRAWSYLKNYEQMQSDLQGDDQLGNGLF